MTIYTTEQLTLPVRREMIRESSVSTEVSFTDPDIDRIIEVSDSMSRVYLPQSVTVLSTSSVNHVAEKVTIPIEIIQDDVIAKRLISISNKLASIFFLIRIITPANNSRINLLQSLYKEIIQVSNQASPLQRRTTIIQINGLIKKSLGTFG